MEKESFISLLTRYQAGEASELEEQLVENYFNSYQGQNWASDKYGASAEAIQRIREQLLSRVEEGAAIPMYQQKQKLPVISRFRWAAAAIFILAIAGVFLLIKPKDRGSITAKVQQDIAAPDKNKATITLPNGKTILLDTVPNGTLIAGIARKTAEGRLVFETDASASAIGYIITSNPRNSKAMYVELPDHSKVWLNADTKLRYPTNYNTKDRLVTLSGEAYFEVKHNAAKPFRVLTGEQTIEDIGTAFNVKAYEDEKGVQTTLLEGVVKINPADGGTVYLKPGEQYSQNKITHANIDAVMSWKNGSFYLDGADLGTVANELGRWYDVEIVFSNPESIHSIVFGGEMGRDLSLTEAIGILEKLNVRCRLENKKLIVE